MLKRSFANKSTTIDNTQKTPTDIVKYIILVLKTNKGVITMVTIEFIPGFIMGIREGLEAFLIIAIMLEYLNKSNV